LTSIERITAGLDLLCDAEDGDFGLRVHYSDEEHRFLVGIMLTVWIAILENGLHLTIFSRRAKGHG